MTIEQVTIINVTNYKIVATLEAQIAEKGHCILNFTIGTTNYLSPLLSVWYRSSDTCQMASLKSFKGMKLPSTQDPSWRWSPHPKIEEIIMSLNDF